MTRILPLGLSFLIFCTTTLSAQSYLDYDIAWAKVDTLTQQNLTRSALAEVQQILSAAKAENNSPQYIKALLHELRLSHNIQEKTDSLAIERMKQEVAQAEGVSKAILQSLLAGMYDQYYLANRWKIMDRTATEITVEDFQTWDQSRFMQTITDLYLASIAQDWPLRKAVVEDYQAILSKEKGTLLYRPTLYDILAHNALDYFLRGDYAIQEAFQVFHLKADVGFSIADSFVKTQLVQEPTNHPTYHVLRIFQDLLRFHLAGGDAYPIVDLDLKRLRYVHQQLNSDQKDVQLMAAYQGLLDQYKRHPVQADIWYAMAQQLQQQGQSFDPMVDNHPAKDAFRTAHQLCRKAIRTYPKSRGAKQSTNLVANLESKSASIQLEGINLPSQPFRIHLQYRNIRRAYFRVIRYSDALQKRLDEFTYQQQKEKLAYLRRQPALRNWSYNLVNDGDFYQHRTEIKANGLEAGQYLLMCGDHSAFINEGYAMTYIPFTVSNLAYMLQQEPETQTLDLWVKDRKSGEPLPAVPVELFVEKRAQGSRQGGEWVAKQSLITDEQGKVSATELNRTNANYQFRIQQGKDRLTANAHMWYYGDFSERDNPQNRVAIFTDRAIYRPGQIIYFKAIVMEKRGEAHRILTNHDLDFQFRDANNQELSQLRLTSNEFGSVSGQFVAPSSGVTGRMKIICNGGNHSIQVEEYKRPTFEVRFSPIEGEFSLGDSIVVEGLSESFSGAPISGAEVRYRVSRNARYPFWGGWWRRSYFPSTPQEIANGTLTTDDKGAFSLTFEAEPDKKVDVSLKPIFTYMIHADVVDISGETRSRNTYVQVGYSSLEIDLTVPERIEKTNLKPFQLSTKNLSGNFQPTKGIIEIYPIETPKGNYRPRNWPRADRHVLREAEYRRFFPHDPYQDEHERQNWTVGELLIQVPFDTEEGTDLHIEALKSAPPGLYRAVMIAGEDSIRTNAMFTLFNRYQKRPPISVWLDANLNTSTAQPGDTVHLDLLTNERNLWVLYQLHAGTEVIEERTLRLGRGQQTVPIAIEESHRGGLSLTLSWLRENHGESEQLQIAVPWTNKQLSLEWASFRSPLQPGQEEQWTLTIKGPQAEMVSAEMVASLYDASLDEFVPHNYGLYLYNQNRSHSSLQLGPFHTLNTRLSGSNWNKGQVPFSQAYQQLDWFGFRLGNHFRRQRAFAVSAPAATTVPRAKAESEGGLFMMDKLEEDGEDLLAIPPPAPPEEPEPTPTSPPIRSNLNETAFFFPHLQTNQTGEVVLNFTMPEALTKWKFLGLAHTKDLKIGTLTGETVTQKELMVVPNLPRFFREKDQMTVTSKLINLSDSDLSGTIELRLFDALTDVPVNDQFANTEAQQSFTIEADRSIALGWEITIPRGIQAVKVQIVADAGAFSDGEEHILPVLSSRMMVTETRPFSVRGKKKKQSFQFPKLLASASSESLTHHKLTLELTSNPAWHAVQALPYLMEFPYDCTEQIFSRFYANALGSHIANSTPQIRQVFEQWKSLPDQKSLHSQLEQNQELKTALLSETPWVLEAKSQSERKKRIALLFDLNRMADEIESSYSQIQQRQNNSGGFSWFPGMDDSPYITNLIVSGLGHLQQLGVNHAGNPEVASMIQRAVGYLDTHLMNLHARLIKREANMDGNHLGNWQIQYLYMRSFHQEIPLARGSDAAFAYYYSQAKTFWNQQTPYMQGMLSLVFHRYEDQQLGQDVIRGMKENAIFSKELGMYWKHNAGWYWYQAPIETQALLIEAFHEVSGDLESVEEMKVWLLQNKRTNDWKTTKATVAACNALLLTGENWLASSNMVEVSLGGEAINPYERPDASVEAGTGHFKTSWAGNLVRPGMGEIDLKRKGKGLAWGALYWQYFEEMDKITMAETPLSIRKELFVEKITSGGPVLTAIATETPIQAGDKVVVRVEIRVDRDMEFVHLKDMRAAGFEPINVLSTYKYQGGLGYYESTRDAATHFFMDRLPKGTWVFEYPLRATLGGDFSNGITSMQCMYAPEFSSHSAGIRVKIE